ncbi:MAG: zf-HC2 domain-containing protein [Archangium sp.]|nr:zf-HC2 domain-containing protein [Archangium sp.]
MNCEAARAAMEEQFAGEVLAERAEQLRLHLQTCESCRERYDRLARVDLSLSGGGLSEQRLDALQARILGRSAVTPPVHPEQGRAAPPPASRRGAWLTLAAAAAVLVVVAIPVWRAMQDDPFTPRGGGTSWGVRAFCVSGGAVTGEALAGGTLACAPGSVVQFTYTAPQTAQLSIALEGSGQRFFPDGTERAAVDAGIDVPLPLSTPVGAWLSGPQRVTARFTDASGAVLAESTLTVTP